MPVAVLEPNRNGPGEAQVLIYCQPADSGELAQKLSQRNRELAVRVSNAAAGTACARSRLRNS